VDALTGEINAKVKNISNIYEFTSNLFRKITIIKNFIQPALRNGD